MAIDEPRVVASAPAGGGRVSPAAVLGTLVLLLAGVAFGAVLAGGGEESGTPVPSVDEDGLPSGFAQSETGAAQAAAAYTDLFSLELVLDPDRTRAALQRIGTPQFAERQAKALRRSRRPIARAAERPGGIGATGGASAVEVERYTGEEAAVRIVSVAAVGARGESGQLSVEEERMRLRWEAEQWRAVAFDGPAREIVELEVAPAGSNAIRAALEGTEIAR